MGANPTKLHMNAEFAAWVDRLRDEHPPVTFPEICRRAAEEWQYPSGASCLQKWWKGRQGARRRAETMSPESDMAATGGTAQLELGDTHGSLVSFGDRISTLEEALAACEVDLSEWEVQRWIRNTWEMGAKLPDGRIAVTPLWQVKVWFKRKRREVRSLELLLEQIAEASPRAPKGKYPKPARRDGERIYEVGIADPHLGLLCHRPGADGDWSLDRAREMVLGAVDRLLAAAEQYGPFKYILWPFGNDWLHADNVWHTTTAGTPQPEAESWQYAYAQAEKLAIEVVERLRDVAPVRALTVMGNHARQSEYTLGRVLHAWFRNDPNVDVDAGASPYKFHRYGVNLLGFEHGHSVKPIRLAALMANECADVWGETRYREWHLGDQHRKGSMRPTVLEEQGVSVEYLPGMTPPNEWHRIKSFNWQKRGAMGYVWDRDRGPVARLQVNVDAYAETWYGEKPAERRGRRVQRKGTR